MIGVHLLYLHKGALYLLGLGGAVHVRRIFARDLNCESLIFRVHAEVARAIRQIIGLAPQVLV